MQYKRNDLVLKWVKVFDIRNLLVLYNRRIGFIICHLLSQCNCVVHVLQAAKKKYWVIDSTITGTAIDSNNNSSDGHITWPLGFFASETSGSMYHLHDDPADKDMLPDTVNNGFKYSAAVTGDVPW
jgi:hypothetical protein